jgi:hypothetical protein
MRFDGSSAPFSHALIIGFSECVCVRALTLQVSPHGLRKILFILPKRTHLATVRLHCPDFCPYILIIEEARLQLQGGASGLNSLQARFDCCLPLCIGIILRKTIRARPPTDVP